MREGAVQEDAPGTGERTGSHHRGVGKDSERLAEQEPARSNSRAVLNQAASELDWRSCSRKSARTITSQRRSCIASGFEANCGLSSSRFSAFCKICRNEGLERITEYPNIRCKECGAGGQTARPRTLLTFGECCRVRSVQTSISLPVRQLLNAAYKCSGVTGVN